MKFFNIDAHISVIADIKDIFKNLGHNIDSLSISGHSWVFNKQQDNPEVINAYNWKNIDEHMCDAFYKKYEKALDHYDGFLCTYPPAFSQLYQKFNKPIIVVAATRYEYPYTFDKQKWKKFNTYLDDNKNIIKICNNLFDKYYCEIFTNSTWKYIPSLCEYTNSKYLKQKEDVILFSKIKKIDFLIDKNILGKYLWEDLYRYKAIVHIPYNYSTMSMFEQYTANVPLFVPDSTYLTQMFLEKVAMTEISFRQVYNKHQGSELDIFKDPNIYDNLTIFLDNINYADFYNKDLMPHIQFFSSEEDLRYKLYNLNFKEISSKMQSVNVYRKETIYKLWKDVLNGLL